MLNKIKLQLDENVDTDQNKMTVQSKTVYPNPNPKENCDQP